MSLTEITSLNKAEMSLAEVESRKVVLVSPKGFRVTKPGYVRYTRLRFNLFAQRAEVCRGSSKGVWRSTVPRRLPSSSLSAPVG